MKKILLLLLLAISLSGCEKDDICTEETTPRLVVEFYDTSIRTNLKNVLNLKVKEATALDFIVFDETLPVTDSKRYLYNGNKIELPLKINGTAVNYSLLINTGSTTSAPNEDFLQFNYTPQNVFVSRACGYKSIFDLNATNGLVLSDAAIPDSFWIQDYTILTTNITTENETHIKIYF